MTKKHKIITTSSVIVILFLTVFLTKDFFNKKASQSEKTSVSAIIPNFTKKEFTDIIMANSSGIILGTIKSLDTAREPSTITPDKIDIVTNATINVDKYIFNPKSLSYEQIIVQTIGGKIENEEMMAEHTAKFLIGEKVVVVLDKAINNNKFTVLGWEKGKYSVDKDNLIEFFGEKISLDKFEEYINNYNSIK